MSTAAISAKGASLRRFSTVSTSGTAVTWVSGAQFTSALTGQTVTINGVGYTFTYVSATSGTLGSSAGTQTAVQMSTHVLFGEIAEVKKIAGPSLKVDTVDVTSHQSTGAWKEFIPVLKESGDVTFDVNYVPTDVTINATNGVLDDLENARLRSFSLVFPDNATDSLKTRWDFVGYVTAVSPDAPHDNVLAGSITIKVTGAPTLN
jgi:hypothetical protein